MSEFLSQACPALPIETHPLRKKMADTKILIVENTTPFDPEIEKRLKTLGYTVWRLASIWGHKRLKRIPEMLPRFSLGQSRTLKVLWLLLQMPRRSITISKSL